MIPCTCHEVLHVEASRILRLGAISESQSGCVAVRARFALTPVPVLTVQHSSLSLPDPRTLPRLS
jgi:hypothetical protein